MTRLDELDEKTHSKIAPDPRTGTQPRLLAMWEGGYESCFLPIKGSVTLGRSPNVDLRIASTSVSREHARVTSGSPPMIQDLGSSNGTRVDGQLLEPGQRMALTPGRVIEVGDALIVLQEGQAEREPRTLPNGPLTLPPSPPMPQEGKMDRLFRLVDLVATGTLSVILQGETGVGKEVMAKRIHQRSARADKPFLKINCAAFAESMVEAELFGHERGAFTGAVLAKAGLLEAGSGGTVLLDEVAELSLPMQAKLLRAVGNSEVLRIGSLKPRPIDVRFIAATNGDFNDLIARGAFRSDLYFRLNGICLTIPALREREDEIIPLAREFVTELSAVQGLPAAKLSPASLNWLMRHRWPGNIRELRSVIERAVLLARGGSIEPSHLQVDRDLSGGALDVSRGTPMPSLSSEPIQLEPRPNRAQAFAAATTSAASSEPALPAPEPEKLRAEVERLERDRIADAIARCGGNQTKAAEVLGISRRALLHRLDLYGLPRPRKGS
jgi:DNA-binding NtrC family response regulator